MDWLAQLASDHQIAYSSGVGIIGAALVGAARFAWFKSRGDRLRARVTVAVTAFLLVVLLIALPLLMSAMKAFGS